MSDKERVISTIVELLKNEGVTRIALFGSYARGEEKPGSDVDIVVDFAKSKSLLQLVRIERELSEALGLKVHLLTEKAISPYLVDIIKKEMQVVYG